MQANDVLIQASTTTASGDEWHVIHRSVGPIASLGWIQALSVARRVARHEKVDVYRATAGCNPTLCESYRA